MNGRSDTTNGSEEPTNGNRWAKRSLNDSRPALADGSDRCESSPESDRAMVGVGVGSWDRISVVVEGLAR